MYEKAIKNMNNYYIVLPIKPFRKHSNLQLNIGAAALVSINSYKNAVGKKGWRNSVPERVLGRDIFLAFLKCI